MKNSLLPLRAPRLIRDFVSDNSGAVTVDWVVLTAAIIGVSLSVGVVVITGAKDLASDVSTAVADVLETEEETPVLTVVRIRGRVPL